MKKTIFLIVIVMLSGCLQAQKLFKENDLYGIKDETGEVLLKPQYQEILMSEVGYWYLDKGKWGLLDTGFKRIIKPKYMSVTAGYSNAGLDMEASLPDYYILELADGQYQFSSGYVLDIFPKKPVSEYKTVDLEGFDPHIIAKQKGKYGLIYILEPYWVLAPKFESVQVMAPSFYLTQQGTKWQVYEGEDVVSTFLAKEVKHLKERMLQVKEKEYFELFELDADYRLVKRLEDTFDSLKEDQYGYRIFKDKKQGFIYGKNQHVDIPIAYDKIHLVESSLMQESGEDDFFEEMTFGEEKPSEPNDDQGPSIDYREELQALVQQGELYGLWIGNEGAFQEVIPAQFKDFKLLEWSEESTRLLLQNAQGKWGIFKGKQLDISSLTFPYENISYQKPVTTAYRLIAKKDGRYGMIDPNTLQSIGEFTFDQLRYTDRKGIFQGQKEGKTVWIFSQTIVEDNLEEIKEIYRVVQADSLQLLPATASEEAIPMKRGTSWGLVTALGKELLMPEYEEINALGNQYYLLKKKKKWGLAKLGTDDWGSANGYSSVDIVLPYEMEEVQALDKTNWLLVSKNGKKGVIDRRGREILPVEYDQLVYKLGYSWGGKQTPAKFILEKNGKKGIKNIGEREEVRDLYMYDFIATEYDSIGKKFYPSNFIPVQKSGKWGLIDEGGKLILPLDFEELMGDSFVIRAKKGRKWGAFKLLRKEGNTGYELGDVLLPHEYDSLYYQEGMSYYLVTRKNGKEGLIGLSKEHEGRVFPPEYDWVMYESKTAVRIRKAGKVGVLNLETGKVAYGKSIASLFSLQWKTPIGQTVFRTNPMLANGQIVIGSNGVARNQADAKDGIYLINPTTGKVNLLIRPEESGKIDVNGQAIDGDRIYFGNENGNLYCYDFSGKQLWQASMEGEVENSPALADFNQDGQLDAVFASDAGMVVALNGTDGSKLWEYKHGKYGYFMATPTCIDLNGDKIADVVIGMGGSGDLFAFNGKNGSILWKNEYSGIHNPIQLIERKDGMLELACAPSYGGIIFLNTKGEVQRVLSSEIGNFALPRFLPNGNIMAASTWWDGLRDKIAFYQTKGKGVWKPDSRAQYDRLQTSAQLQKLLTHSISSTGFVADITENEGLEVGVASEAADFFLFDQNGKLLSQVYLPSGVEAPMLVKDLDGDGKLEVLIAGLDGYLYCYQTQSSGKVVAGQFMGNNQNTGVQQLD